MVEWKELPSETKEGRPIVYVRQAGRTPATGYEVIDPKTGAKAGHISRIDFSRREYQGRRGYHAFTTLPSRPSVEAAIRRSEEKKETAELARKEAEFEAKRIAEGKIKLEDVVLTQKGATEELRKILEKEAARKAKAEPVTREEERELEKLSEIQRRTLETLRAQGKKVEVRDGLLILEERGRVMQITRTGASVRAPPSAVISPEELELERLRRRERVKVVKPKEPVFITPEREITPEELVRKVAEERGIPIIEPITKEEALLKRYRAIGEEPGVMEAFKEIGIGIAEAPYLYFKGLKEIMTPIGVRDVMEFPEKARELFRKPEVQVAAIGSLAMALPLPVVAPLAVGVTGYETYKYAKEPTPRQLGRVLFYAATTGIIVNKLIKSRYKVQTSKLSPDKQKRLDEYLKLAEDVQAKTYRNLEPSKVEALRHIKNSKALNKALNDYFIKNPDIIAGGTYGQRTTLKGKGYTGARLPQDGDLYINMKNKEIHTRNIMNIIRRFTDRRVYVKPDGTIMVQNPVGESNAFSFHDLSKLKAKIKSFHPIKGEFWKHYGVIETPDGTKVLNPKYQAEFKISGAMYQRYQTLSKQVKKGKVSKEFMQKKIVQDYADFKAILDSSGIETTVFTKLGKKAAYYGFPPMEYRPAGIPFIYPFITPPKYPPTPPRKPPVTPPYPPPYPPTRPPVTPPYPPTKYPEPITPTTFITPYPPPKPPVTPPYPPPTKYPTPTTFITPYPPPKPPVTPPITRVPEEPEIKPTRFVTKRPPENAYDILIRKGEKRGDKFVKIDEEDLPENKAKRKLVEILDTYIEASGRVRKSDRLTTVPDDPRPPDLRKFRSPVPKSKLPPSTLIEMARFRLDSAKELQQISFFREQALRKKATLERQITFIKTQQKKAQLRTRITEEISFIKSKSSSSKKSQSGFLKTKGTIKFL